LANSSGVAVIAIAIDNFLTPAKNLESAGMKNYQKSVYLVRFNSGKKAKKRFKHLKNEQESH
jgi:hypothetical protein